MVVSTQEHVERLDDVGWTIVEQAIDPRLIDELEAALHDLEDRLGITPSANTSRASTKRVFNLLAHEGPWPEVPVHPAIAPVIEGVLGEGFLISSLASVSIGPGEAATDPRRRSDDAHRQAPLPDGVQHDVGAHRLHRCKRRNPPRPG